MLRTPRRPRLCSCLWLGVALFSLAPRAAAVELPPWLQVMEPEQPLQRAIQTRRYPLHSELSLLLGTLPSDRFHRTLSVAGAGVTHFNDHVAWQIAGLSYVLGQPTDLYEALDLILATRGEPPPLLPRLRGVLSSQLVFKPIYGKQALGPHQVVYAEAYAQAGPALVWLDSHSQAAAFAPGVDWALGLRVHGSARTSFRLQLGQTIFLLAKRPFQALRVEAGLALNLGAPT